MGLTSKFLLDNMVISYFWNAGHRRSLEQAATTISLVTATEVRTELGRAKGDGPGRATWLDRSGIELRGIGLESPAAATLRDFSRLKETLERGEGERACIALAAHDDALTFVSNDANALAIALRELHAPGERLIGVPVFLRRLAHHAALARKPIEDVFALWRGKHGPVPTWWPAWIKTVSV